MGQLTNQIRVLLQRVKMAGREPHKILMHQGIKESLKNEMQNEQEGRLVSVRAEEWTDDKIYDPKLGACEITFDGIPIVVDNSIGEILVQVKPLKYAEKDIVSKVPWSKILKMKRL